MVLLVFLRHMQGHENGYRLLRMSGYWPLDIRAPTGDIEQQTQ